MSKSKYTEFAVGWMKKSDTRGEYISAVLAKGNPSRNKPGVAKLTVELDNGETLEVSGFAVYFNDNKTSDKAPDVNFVFSTDAR